MKATVLQQFGDPEQLIIEDKPKPVPGDKQVLLRVKSIGINPVDTKVRNGSNKIAQDLNIPTIIGWDASGVVAACGKEVTDFKKGDPVFGCIGFPGAGGAYAEYALADEGDIATKPDNISFRKAAALPIVGLTAYQSIHEHLAVQPNQQVLIQAAAGGVGHLSVQFAKQAGAYVIGTASAGNRNFLLGLGADEVIDYKNEDFEDHLSNLDAVQDAMGGDVLYRSIKCTREGGKVVCLPSYTKDDPKAIELANQEGVDLEWIMMRASKKHLQEIVRLMSSGQITVNIDHIFSFEEIPKAHRAVETHSTRGKVVVEIAD